MGIWGNHNSNQVGPNIPFKRLTWAKMQARREKGLCYNCKEKFGLGHCCKAQQAFLLPLP
uniref:Uncharacterized protein n=1 Tax=Nelumbo nucifera TaxID=4432 RepID=A0A822Z7L8_NELNU|nr:TPA_asm: hypothetical protein HUJ06_013288 [Nelumbo nucifera]